MHPRVAILLSTCDGEPYLAEQLDSLIAQSYDYCVVVIRDDGSRDGTAGIIHAYADRYPNIFHRIENDGRNYGARGSYSFLMDYVLRHKKELGLERAYMALCDQDDIWSGNKIELEMEYMQQCESRFPEAPVLVHSDLEVVSDSGSPLADSFMRYQGLDAAQNRFGQVLFYNPVTGCTALINESLAVRALPVPERAVMHDWWLALCASAFGRIAFLDMPLVRYRQHASNTLGAVRKPSGRSLMDYVRRIRQIAPDPSLGDQAVQAVAFKQRFRERLKPGQKGSILLASLMRVRSGFFQRVLRRAGRTF